MMKRISCKAHAAVLLLPLLMMSCDTSSSGDLTKELEKPPTVSTPEARKQRMEKALQQPKAQQLIKEIEEVAFKRRHHRVSVEATLEPVLVKPTSDQVKLEQCDTSELHSYVEAFVQGMRQGVKDEVSNLGVEFCNTIVNCYKQLFIIIVEAGANKKFYKKSNE